jgi:hypothetical protein
VKPGSIELLPSECGHIQPLRLSLAASHIHRLSKLIRKLFDSTLNPCDLGQRIGHRAALFVTRSLPQRANHVETELKSLGHRESKKLSSGLRSIGYAADAIRDLIAQGIDLRRQFHYSPPRIHEFGAFRYRLLQERVDGRFHSNGHVELRVRTRRIRSDVDQVLDIGP